MYQETFVKYNQQTLFQATRLQHKDTLLIFFHGVGDSHLNFVGFFDRPELNDCDIFVADLLGHGRSSNASDYSFHHQCLALEAQLKNIIPNYKNIIFVPHSMGGIHATMLANEPFRNIISGIFAFETSVTQYGSFIAEQVTKIVNAGQDFSKWYTGFCEQTFTVLAKDNEILRRYYAGLQFVRPQAFYENALEMFTLATALKDEEFTSKIGHQFAQLPIPKVYCLGEKGNQKPSLPFLKAHNIPAEFFPTLRAMES